MKDDCSGTHLWLVMWKAWTALRAWDEQSIAGLGLCLSDFAVLEVLLHKGPLPVNEIGRKVMLTSGSITTAITRLERRALLVRQPCPHDARVVLVALTAAGKRFITPIFARHARNLEQAVGVLSAAERRQLLPLLRKLGYHAASLNHAAAAAAPPVPARRRRAPPACPL